MTLSQPHDAVTAAGHCHGHMTLSQPHDTVTVALYGIFSSLVHGLTDDGIFHYVPWLVMAEVELPPSPKLAVPACLCR